MSKEMVKISKMKYRGCCVNCFSTKNETDIYRIYIKSGEKIELCENCLSDFVKELNEEYSIFVKELSEKNYCDLKGKE